MKKIFLFCALLAGIAVMTGCQKDQDVVTLKAIIAQDSKAYFGPDDDDNLSLPYWDGDDEVYIKGLTSFRTNTFGLTNPSTTVATITDVPYSDVYCAIYPARIFQEGSMSTPDANGTTASIYFNPEQIYKWENNRQRVDMPMGAVTSGETLIFKNLCSILRLNVSNSLANTTDYANVDFNVKRLTIQAYGAYVAGYADVTLYEDNDPDIDINTPHHNSQDNVLSVYERNHQSMGTIYHSNTNNHPTSKPFDVVVPPFNASRLVLEVEMDKHNADGSSTPLGYYEYSIDNPASVGRNKIIEINMTVDEIHKYDYAYLKPGPAFNAVVQAFLANNSNVNAIMFNIVPGDLTSHVTEANEWVEGSTPDNWIELQADNSPRKIYGYVSGNTLIINSYATSIYANSNCKGMFKNLTSIINIQTSQAQLFVTEDVTDMSYMFAGCTNLNILQGISFNTTNVTNMSHMFEGSRTPNSLNLASFHTHHVSDTGMVAMFKNTTNLSELILSNFTAERITSLEDMFSGSASLTTVQLPIFNTAQVTNMKNMFNGCVAMTSLHLSAFNMSNVSNENKLNMFKDMANSKSAENHCTVYCPLTVEQAILVKDGNGNYYSGLDESPNGNYNLYKYWTPEEHWGRRIVFARSTTSK